MTTTAITPASDPILATEFVQEMVRQMRALDTYGRLDGKPAAELLAPLVRTRERKAQIPVVGDPDALTLARIRAFYRRAYVPANAVLIVIGAKVIETSTFFLFATFAISYLVGLGYTRIAALNMVLVAT